jgi:hypothetical protein
MENQSSQSPTNNNKSNFEQPSKNMKRGITAVVVGTIIDGGGSYIVNIIYLTIFMFQRTNQLISQGLSESELHSQLAADLNSYIPSTALIIVALLVPLTAGYITGRIAKQNEIIYGFLTGVTTTVMVEVCRFTFHLSSAYPLLTAILLASLSIGGAYLGGYLAYRRRIKLFTSNT